MGGAVIRVFTEPEGIAWLEMRDARGPNAFTRPFIDALLSALDEVRAMQEVKVLLLAGLPEVFCSGASDELLRDLQGGSMLPTELTLGRRLLEMPVPVIAVCEGAAIGGGFALALSADLVVLAEESRYGLNFLSLGFTPGMGTTTLLTHITSPAIAHELLYTGEFRAGRCFAGGANAVVPKSQVRGRALDLALRLAEKPREALILLKRTLSLPRRRSLEEALTMESFMHGLTLTKGAR